MQNEIYDSNHRPIRVLDELQQVIRYRYLLAQLLRRDILTRYKRSLLGIAWTMLNPLGMMIVLTIAFSAIFGGEPSFPAYILSGLIAWTFFSQTTTAAIINLIWGGSLLHRVFIPRTSFGIAAIGTGVVNILFSMVPMFIVMLVTGIKISWAILFLPVPILLLAAFALGFGLILSTFAVYFPDVVEMYQIILAGWMYLCPIVYPEKILPPATLWAIQTFNPMYILIKLFRMPLYNGLVPGWNDLLPGILIAVVTLALGWWIFTKKSDVLSYRI